MSSERRMLKDFIHAWLTHMHQLVTFSQLSSDVDNRGTGSKHVVASIVAISYGSPASL
jgi:hypothetical protein